MTVTLQELKRGVINAADLRCPGLTMPVVSLVKKSRDDFSVIVFAASEKAQAVGRLRVTAKVNNWLTGSDAPFHDGLHMLIIYHSPAAKAFATQNDLAIETDAQAG